VEEFQDYRELLDDSMVQLLMSVDDVDVDHLMRVLERVASALRDARSTEDCDHAVPRTKSRSAWCILAPHIDKPRAAPQVG
jgi:hypothetical protein